MGRDAERGHRRQDKEPATWQQRYGLGWRWELGADKKKNNNKKTNPTVILAIYGEDLEKAFDRVWNYSKQ